MSNCRHYELIWDPDIGLRYFKVKNCPICKKETNLPENPKKKSYCVTCGKPCPKCLVSKL
jgi:hypothetical protein